MTIGNVSRTITDNDLFRFSKKSKPLLKSKMNTDQKSEKQRNEYYKINFTKKHQTLADSIVLGRSGAGQSKVGPRGAYKGQIRVASRHWVAKLMSSISVVV